MLHAYQNAIFFPRYINCNKVTNYQLVCTMTDDCNTLLSMKNSMTTSMLHGETKKDAMEGKDKEGEMMLQIQEEDKNEVGVSKKLQMIWDSVHQLNHTNDVHRPHDGFDVGNNNEQQQQQKSKHTGNTNNSNKVLTSIDTAIQETIQLIQNEMDSSIVMKCCSIQLYIESVQQHVQQYECALQNLYTENQQLHVTIQNQQHMITNLLQAVQDSQTKSQDTSQGIMNEARLRAELSHMTSQRDDALGQVAEYKHKVALLQDQLMDLKMKCSRLQQQKMQYERSNNMMSSTSTSIITPSAGMPAGNATSNEYYQRKLSESNEKVASLQSTIIEKNRQIDDLRYQMERNMSHHLQQQQKQYYK